MTKIRQNPKMRIAGSALLVVSILLYIPSVGADLPDVVTGNLVKPILTIVGLLLCNTGGDTSVDTDFVKFGFTRLLKSNFRHVDASDERGIVLTLKNSRTYLFRRRNYHPDDWSILKGHLESSTCPVSTPENSPPATHLVEY